MTDQQVETTVSGGQIQGIAGAGSVVIENFTIYNRATEEPNAIDLGADAIPSCPYPGLAYFGPDDADLFFGRDVAIARLMEAVGRQSLTALVGASGSGKSSVVLAGLAPRLHKLGNWRFSHFRLGTELEHDPFTALARALVPLYVVSDDETDRLANTKKLASKLQVGELTLRDVFADCRSRNKSSHILLIADQFEETFTLIDDEAVRRRFIDVLLAGFPVTDRQASPDICLILTLRGDFYGQALRYKPLVAALQSNVENLSPLDREELRTAINRPAENAKVSFEPGLVDSLLDEVRNKPGSLPLLQFALREMWGRQQNRKITHKSYNDIGGVESALAQRAEAIFEELTVHGADTKTAKAFQRLFTRLVNLGEGQEDTRRVVERPELSDDVWSLAQRLANEGNRLVVTNAPSPSRQTVEVIHEALIRHWPKLVGWINRDREFQSWLRQIKPAIDGWRKHPDDEGILLRGGPLTAAQDWLVLRTEEFSVDELQYVNVSLERDSERRRRARAVRAIAFLLVICVAVFVTWQWRLADQLRSTQQQKFELAMDAFLINEILEEVKFDKTHIDVYEDLLNQTKNKLVQLGLDEEALLRRKAELLLKMEKHDDTGMWNNDSFNLESAAIDTLLQLATITKDPKYTEQAKTVYEELVENECATRNRCGPGWLVSFDELVKRHSQTNNNKK
jgi:hypothetical protein